MFIGRIITDSIIGNTLKYIDITADTTKCIGSDIPVLIVGKKLAQSIYPKNKVKVLDREIEKNIFWTYSKFEKRNEYEKDLSKFMTLVIKSTIKSVKYRYMDIFLMSCKTLKGFITFMKGKWKKIVYITDKHLYIYYNKTVYGISLSQTDYIGVKRNKLINKIRTNSYNIVIDDNAFISDEIKKHINNSEIMVPYFYFIKENS